MEFCGIKFAPLNIPFQRRIQTFAAATTFYTIALGPFIFMFVTYYLIAHTRLWWLTIIYVAFCYFDKDVCNKGGRPSSFVQGLSWWKYYADYNSIKVHRSGNKHFNPKKNYLMCFYPHGLLPTGMVISMCTSATQFQQFFPYHKSRVVTLTMHYLVPFFRELMLSIGGISSNPEAINHVLNKPEGGYLLGLTPGGAQEALYSYPGQYKIILKHRTGFVKLALKSGAQLVPVFSFGETDIFTQIKNKSVIAFLEKFRKIFGFAPIIPIGRGFFQYSFGFVQFRIPINVVVGDPIDVTKNENPTKQEIKNAHEKFTQALQKLFDEHKHLYVKNANRVCLEII